MRIARLSRLAALAFFALVGSFLVSVYQFAAADWRIGLCFAMASAAWLVTFFTTGMQLNVEARDQGGGGQSAAR